jgi:hypothetical protein
MNCAWLKLAWQYGNMTNALSRLRTAISCAAASPLANENDYYLHTAR